MSLPNVLDFRQRVETIPDLDKRIAFQTLHLICGRVGEIITEKYPSDKTCHPTGTQLTVRKAIYQPELTDPQERDTWTFIKLLQGQPVNFAEISQISEEVAVFHVATEKRGGLTREIGLPLNPQYDPWVKQVYEYLHTRQKNGFQYTRQEMWATAKNAFTGFTYKIHPYQKAMKGDSGEYLYKENGKLLKKMEPEKIKNFTDHGIRHLRNLELKKFYGLTPEERAGYGGWTLATVTGTSAAQDRYEESPWRVYFPKLLRQR